MHALALTLVAALSLSFARTVAGQEELPRHAGTNLVNETPAQHDARLAWFRDAQFGMFIHWGA